MAKPEHPAIVATRHRRAAIVLGAVISAHLALLALALTARDITVERPIEPRTITALLLSPEPEPTTPTRPVTPATPAAVVAPTPAPPARPAVRVKPSQQPRPRVPRSVETPAPVALPQNTAPPAATPAAPVAAIPSPAAPIAASAPAAERTMPASSAPKNVSHIDCTIPKPDYPDISKRRSESGTAIVRFVVGLAGGIETVQLQQSSGYARLDEAALAAVHASVCRPYSENGAAVRAAYSQSFVFGLTD
ncbi:TonB family protein [Paraburkholderia fungorum]|uniref:energy transducer TonB n=1 Tax=Paraburkholderia fungorum TaxID=134537 RepID=UPI0038BB0259